MSHHLVTWTADTWPLPRCQPEDVPDGEDDFPHPRQQHPGHDAPLKTSGGGGAAPETGTRSCLRTHLLDVATAAFGASIGAATVPWDGVPWLAQNPSQKGMGMAKAGAAKASALSMILASLTLL